VRWPGNQACQGDEALGGDALGEVRLASWPATWPSRTGRWVGGGDCSSWAMVTGLAARAIEGISSRRKSGSGEARIDAPRGVWAKGAPSYSGDVAG